MVRWRPLWPPRIIYRCPLTLVKWWSNAGQTSTGPSLLLVFQNLKISFKASVVRESRCIFPLSPTFPFCCWLMTNEPSSSFRWNAAQPFLQQRQDRQKEVDSTSIREAPPTTIPDSEISRSEACRDLTLRNADNTLEMRGSGDRKMSHNAAFCLGERPIRRPSGLPALLFREEEAGRR